jgi:hypothetical protein
VRDIEDRVLLLAIYKKHKDESLSDTLLMLEDAGVFSLKEGKRRLKELKKTSFFSGDSLSLEGIEKAKEIESEFKV